MIVVAGDSLRPFLAIAIRRLAAEMERNGLCPPADALRLARELLPEAGEPPVADLDLLDAQRAARRLGISRRTLERRVAAGDVVPVRVGRRVLFRPSDLADLIGRAS